MANGEEEPVDSNVVVALVGKSAPVDDVRAFHSIRTEESFGVRFEQDFDFWIRHDLLLHRFRCAEEWLAHDEVDFGCQSCKVCGFFAGRVAASHNGYVLFAVEEPVACCTGTDAKTFVFLFVGQAEVFSRGACGDDECLALHLVSVVEGERVGGGREVGFHGDGRTYLRAEADGLGAHVVHHLVAVDALRVAWEVVDLGRRCELSAWLEAFVDHGSQSGAGGIDGGGVAGGARAQDEASYCFHKCECVYVV